MPACTCVYTFHVCVHINVYALAHADACMFVCVYTWFGWFLVAIVTHHHTMLFGRKMLLYCAKDQKSGLGLAGHALWRLSVDVACVFWLLLAQALLASVASGCIPALRLCSPVAFVDWYTRPSTGPASRLLGSCLVSSSPVHIAKDLFSVSEP